MLMILVNWIYVAVTTFCLGYAVSELSGKCFSYRIKRIDSLLVAGLVAATVYAQIFSLFYRVSLLANVILVLICVLSVVFFGKNMWKTITQAWQGCGKLTKILIPVLFLVWAYCTSRGNMVYDTQLYHSQAIRWLEEYGIVPGQGIMLSRFAYNSSIFSVSALYSMKFIFGQSVHAICGWIAFLLSVCVLDIRRGAKKLRWSDFANVAAIYYLCTIYDEVISPSSDYATMCIAFFLIIKWIRLLEVEADGQAKAQPETAQAKSGEKAYAPYALLCVLGVFILTTKLTAGLILILLIKPAYLLIKNKAWKEIFGYLATGLLVAVPWLIRGVLISGWLFYPLPQLDLFDLPWKLPVEFVEMDAAQILTWGRGLRNAELIDVPVWEWFGNWFMAEISVMEKLIVLADLAAIVLFAGWAIRSFCKRKWENLDKQLVVLTVVASYAYWQLSAPLPRYGYTYMLLVPFLMLGIVVLRVGKDRLLRCALALYGVYKCVVLFAYMYSCSWYPSYVAQVDYETYEEAVPQVEVDGHQFYFAPGVAYGYDYFPATENYPVLFRMRGEEIEDGFEWVTLE